MDWGKLEAGVQGGSAVREPGWSEAWQEVGLRRTEQGEDVGGHRASLKTEGRRHRVFWHCQALNLCEVTH